MREFFRDAMLTLGVIFGGLQVFLIWHRSDPQVPSAAQLPLTHPVGGPILVAVLFIIAGLLNIAPLIRRLFPASITEKDSAHSERPTERRGSDERRQSQTFVLEVDGTRPLDGDSDWKFYLTNCSTRILRYVQIGMLRSEIGAFQIGFNEVPVMQPGEKASLCYHVFPRRQIDVYSNRTFTLWDFAIDHAGERGSTFIWYDLAVQYRDDDDSMRDGGLLGVCFDLDKKILKTEGADYFRENSYQSTLEGRQKRV